MLFVTFKSSLSGFIEYFESPSQAFVRIRSFRLTPRTAKVLVCLSSGRVQDINSSKPSHSDITYNASSGGCIESVAALVWDSTAVEARGFWQHLAPAMN